MEGIVLVNKPCHITSRDVVNQLNKLFHTKRIGHTGTLDPLATGVLVCCIGKYTKLVNQITSYDKEYIAEIKLGIKTDTGDITGKVIETKEYFITKEQLQIVLTSFLGKSIQTIPKYSAVKINGKKLYEYARKNIAVELPKR
ncbi:MAG: tRNA pseudouridine(55) synthase TruB, partial [Bacilli bacterium]|nr:tRNA pseudouridine(55) synthase TruB [Bacilli bacterium]